MATVTRTKPKLHTLDKGRRTDIEADLNDKYNVTWAYLSNVPPNQFDVEKSLHNQARFEPLDEPTVQTYTEAVKRGDVFPAVIAWAPTQSGKYLIIDGNHRLAAHARADRPLEVYEVDPTTDPRVVALMTFAFNTRHGRPTSEAERISQAVYLVDNGATVDAAATAVNLPKALVKRAVARSVADQRADEVGLRRNEWDTLSPSTKARLSALTTDEGFSDAAKLTYAAKLSSEEVFDLVGLVNSTRSGLRQRAMIAHQREILQERIQSKAGGVYGSKRTMGPKQRVSLALAQTLALPDDDALIAAAYAEVERPAAAKRMIQASEKLARLANLLAGPDHGVTPEVE